jgi:hypothetical protein
VLGRRQARGTAWTPVAISAVDPVGALLPPSPPSDHTGGGGSNGQIWSARGADAARALTLARRHPSSGVPVSSPNRPQTLPFVPGGGSSVPGPRHSRGAVQRSHAPTELLPDRTYHEGGQLLLLLIVILMVVVLLVVVLSLSLLLLELLLLVLLVLVLLSLSLLLLLLLLVLLLMLLPCRIRLHRSLGSSVPRGRLLPLRRSHW